METSWIAFTTGSILLDIAIVVALIVVACVVITALDKTLGYEVVVQEHERALLYIDGKYVRTLEPGKHRISKRFGAHEVHSVAHDLRSRTLTVPGQEVLSADNVQFKISLAIRYRIADPVKASHETSDYKDHLYEIAQLALRTKVSALPVEEMVAARGALAEDLLKSVAPLAETIGLAIESVEPKDLMFPADMRQSFAEVTKSRMESRATLERMRGETAALRTLANAARMVESHPGLLPLRVLQSLKDIGQGSGNKVVMRLPEDLLRVSAAGAKADESTNGEA